jgi:hypothetical protein
MTKTNISINHQTTINQCSATSDRQQPASIIDAQQQVSTFWTTFIHQLPLPASAYPFLGTSATRVHQPSSSNQLTITNRPRIPSKPLTYLH